MCSARIKLSLNEFDSLTPVELYELMKEHNDIKFNEYKQEAELKRLFTMILVNTQIKKGSQFSEPRRFLKFAWEEDLDKEIYDELVNTDWNELDIKYGLKKAVC